MADGDFSDAVQTVSRANDLFTSDMYRELAGGQGNLFFSPWSIQVILALAFLGAGGRTAQQMARGLRLPEDKNATEEGFSEILKQLKESDDVILRVANRIFVKQNFTIKERFKQSAKKFMAGAEEMDFKDLGAAGAINSWVAGITNGRIKEVIGKGALGEQTRMVLVNAVYFKGNWSVQFSKYFTEPRPFHPPSQPTKDVDTMFVKDRYMYAEINELNSQVILLPYKGYKVSMLIILPRELNGLPDVEKNLTNVSLQEIISRMYKAEVHVYLPKFKMEYEAGLTGALRKLGMTDMFDDDDADFSGISKKRLKVDDVFHKAFIEVNEEGTEAAAATGVHFVPAPSVITTPPPPIFFKADHPFLFYILDQKTRAVLFAGRISDPSH
ncbi:serpin B6-like [Schistocerca piceifrons]|uniref:serpin B6-like n=1 Tax=Schistocerca piceifrons TaxID=274613 RepID=UPI001F5FBD67|nr:serpin B6-like [Schistocerca piceifrons]XP_047108284.1 serpin B6-like [Schistocerca piceifrons]